MEFRKVLVLQGGNYWTRFPALEVEVLLQDTEAESTSALPGFAERLAALLAVLDRQQPGPNGGEVFFQQVARGTTLPHVLQHLTLLLQLRAGSDVAFGLARAVEPPRLHRVVVEFEEAELARPCLEAARQLCLAALHATPFDAADQMAKLRDLAHEVRLGPSTGSIVTAAKQRGIPVRRLNDESLVQLGHGARQRRIWTAETDRTGAIAEAIAQDKELTRRLLQAAGVPVPEGRPVCDAADAWEAAKDVGSAVVVKPRHGNHGRGVATNLTTQAQVEQAYAAAREQEPEVMVERFVPGSDYRLLVVGDQLVAAAHREPPLVTGDGRSTVAELVAAVNLDPRRSDGHATALSIIKLDAIARAVLAEQGHAPDSVPAAGERVLIRRNANLSSGGTATDVTDRVHPRTVASAVAAARAIGLDIAGVDVVAPGIDQPLQDSGGAVVEVNAGPGLRMHLEPSAGTPRPVGEAIVAMLFGQDDNGRIPIAAVTGDRGQAVARLLARMLTRADSRVGLAEAEGLFVEGRRLDDGDYSGAEGARAVLLNPRVTAAVLQTAPAGILREGLGFDLCDVAVVTGSGETVEELARVERAVVAAVSPEGCAVLDAADRHVAALASGCPGSVVYFARGENETVSAHLAKEGRAALVRAGRIVLLRGGVEEAWLALDGVADTEAALAAAAAAWALGLRVETIREGLA